MNSFLVSIDFCSSARRDAVLPLSKPIRGLDNTEMSEIAIPKNTQLMISILNCNRNPDIWGKDALEWKPERWLQPLPKSVQDAKIPGVYSPLMTFNAGGRSCMYV
jgi:cytochrome P450